MEQKNIYYINYQQLPPKDESQREASFPRAKLPPKSINERILPFMSAYFARIFRAKAKIAPPITTTL